MTNFAKMFAENRANNLMRNTDKVEIAKLTGKVKTLENSNLTSIPGVGGATAERLLEKGINTKEELIEAGIDGVNSLGLNPLSLKAIEKFLINPE